MYALTYILIRTQSTQFFFAVALVYSSSSKGGYKNKTGVNGTKHRRSFRLRQGPAATRVSATTGEGGTTSEAAGFLACVSPRMVVSIRAVGGRSNEARPSSRVSHESHRVRVGFASLVVESLPRVDGQMDDVVVRMS